MRFSVNSERFAAWYWLGWRARRAFRSWELAPGESVLLTRWRRNRLEVLDERYEPLFSAATYERLSATQQPEKEQLSK